MMPAGFLGPTIPFHLLQVNSLAPSHPGSGLDQWKEYSMKNFSSWKPHSLHNCWCFSIQDPGCICDRCILGILSFPAWMKKKLRRMLVFLPLPYFRVWINSFSSRCNKKKRRSPHLILAHLLEFGAEVIALHVTVLLTATWAWWASPPV